MKEGIGTLETEASTSGPLGRWRVAAGASGAAIGLPLATWLALGPEGVVVLAVPQAVIALALWLGAAGVSRAFLRAFLVAGIVGAVFMALVHASGARRPLGAFLLFGSIAGSLGSAIHVLRHGPRRIGAALVGVATLYVALGVAVVILQALAG